MIISLPDMNNGTSLTKTPFSVARIQQMGLVVSLYGDELLSQKRVSSQWQEESKSLEAWKWRKGRARQAREIH